MKIWYYAHSIGIYNTPQEQEELDAILSIFRRACVYNPNRPYIQNHKDPMQACIAVLHDDGITGVVFTAVFGVVTSGVMYEVRTAERLEKPVFYLRDGEIVKFNGKFRKTSRHGKTIWRAD